MFETRQLWPLKLWLTVHNPVMPTVLRIGPYRFHFYSRESNEPPHIHVAREDFEVKFWLHPISVASNYGFSSAEMNDIRRLVEENCDFLVEAYRRYHGIR
jgi:hypothetical protein